MRTLQQLAANPIMRVFAMDEGDNAGVQLRMRGEPAVWLRTRGMVVSDFAQRWSAPVKEGLGAALGACINLLREHSTLPPGVFVDGPAPQHVPFCLPMFRPVAGQDGLPALVKHMRRLPTLSRAPFCAKCSLGGLVEYTIRGFTVPADGNQSITRWLGAVTKLGGFWLLCNDTQPAEDFSTVVLHSG